MARRSAARFLALGLLTVGCSGSATSCSKVGTTRGPTEAPKVIKQATRKSLQAFASQAELEGFLKDLAQARAKDSRRRAQISKSESPAPQAAAPAEAETADESVTNNQHAGVDEGGIVKLHGDHLVILRRGRLFTVEVGDQELKPVAAVDAFGPGLDPSGTWYDEMLVARDTVIVIGYSYQRGGTEVGLFDIGKTGSLKYRDTYHLRSNDYYSSRNYASRLIGDQLIFYSPLYVRPTVDEPMQGFPALRKWQQGADHGPFRSIASPSRVYRPILPSPTLALHTVTVCDLSQRAMDCKATSVMGPPGRVFYVSPSAVYVWATHWEHEGDRSLQQSLAYRLPLDGSAPAALSVAGSPVDQFSFLEQNGHLNVLVRAEAGGEGMWGSEVTNGDVALLRVPVDSFGDGQQRAPRGAYAELPRVDGYSLQNRFVGDYLLYGTGNSWGRPRDREAGQVVAYPYAASGAKASRVALGHGVDRIEALGRDAVIVGADADNLHFTPVSLASSPKAQQRFTRRGVAQGELRSHGFFYKPESPQAGLLGLPIRSRGAPGHSHLLHGSAGILFLKNESLNLQRIGELGARPSELDDGCRASCVDWYGNARPLFLRGRVFALMGYEIVEGRLEDGRLSEQRRVSFAPGRLVRP